MAISVWHPFGRYVRTVVDRRAKPTGPPLTIDRRHLYILPTAGGWLFAGMLVVMLLGATHYSNNLAFALTFWLASIAIVSMHRAHRNLLHLKVAHVQSEPVFAGQSMQFVVELDNAAGNTRRALSIGWADAAHPNAPVTIDAGARRRLVLDYPAARRGALACPAIEITSRFPMGLFRTWTRLRPATNALIYPAREGRHPLATAAGDIHAGHARLRYGESEFIAHRGFVPGDSLRQVDWKASARRDRLLIHENADRTTPELRFSFEALSGLALEAKLSQLALWVDTAYAQNARYQLCLPQAEYGPDQGNHHRRQCLTALARF